MHSRRRFLEAAAAGALVGRAAAEPIELPKVKFLGKTEITRLLIGANPLYGYSHFNPLLDGLMREWMTADRRVETLHRAEAAGINTWQVHYNDPTIEDFKRYRAEGGRMNWLLLADFDLMKNWKLLPAMVKLGPIGIGHHGNRTDERFRAGRMNIVRDFLNAVHDAGAPAGISTHNPQVVAYAEEHNFPNDYYMTCMYRVTRTPEEARQQFGETTINELYYEKDPARMCEMARKTKKPCFAFKLLGAGRNTKRPDQVEQAFRFVLSGIKPQDAVIVGMFPKFKDEMRENAALVRKICLPS